VEINMELSNNNEKTKALLTEVIVELAKIGVTH
jgi:hypothetical protein